MGKELVHVYRGQYVESIHYGSVVVVNAEGELIKSAGDPDFKTFIRSAAKPIQALPVVYSGAMEKYNLTPRELAVMCASHSGEEIHIETVRSILKKINVPEEKLLCGVHPPYHKPSAEALIKAGIEPTSIYCNCSGKHAAMLTLCMYFGWDIDGYIELKHPLQQMMLEVVSDVTDVPKDEFWLGVDGCGVPVFGMPLKNMALGFARLSKPEYLKEKYRNAARIITEAMYTNPMLVAGTDRFCTDLMRVMKGKVVAKAGAEAVYCVGFMDKGIGLAVKIDDGGRRGREVVVLKAMEDLGLISKEELAQLRKYRHPVIKNHHNKVVGELKPVFTLK
ncbi:hypothetical protein BBF96_00320 [Anoxybacter fermentans]|uniref:Asparaginase n=1 Tax=Anoxybacter fermentans TaxID=1323375 RepID=A0A3Q9HND2_9FIRM|nr:asparaginase [Anoxybacter fermentans]AZR71982.1 hypothetical protein BBF96_00320 [Anoxybacter fermentans]